MCVAFQSFRTTFYRVPPEGHHAIKIGTAQKKYHSHNKRSDCTKKQKITISAAHFDFPVARDPAKMGNATSTFSTLFFDVDPESDVKNAKKHV